ncbi:Fc receptor-like protein 5 [Silurus meridionalis]|nr:Fc receptor-like protein 5 [Silurus meridionalis]
MTAIRYWDKIHLPIVSTYAGAGDPEFFLVHDKARPRVARECRQFILEDEEIDTIDWPPCSSTGKSDMDEAENSRERPKAVVTLQPDGQIFSGEKVTLTCEIQGHADTEWTYNWYKDDVEILSYNESRKYSFTARAFYSSYYTCHGQRKNDSQNSETSNNNTLTVTDGDVILDSPLHPVTGGRPLTLRCLFRSIKISDSGAYFYKDDSVLQNQTAGEITFRSVSKSDEGFYQCKHPKRGESPKNWISVRDAEAQVTVFRLISSLVTVSVYLLLTLVLAVKCYRARGIFLLSLFSFGQQYPVG